MSNKKLIEKYKQYLNALKINNYIKTIVFNNRQIRLLKNILERWYIIKLNPNDNKADNFFIESIKIKELNYLDPTVLENIKNIELEINNIPEKILIEKYFDDKITVLKYGEYTFKFPKYRYDILSKTGSDEEILIAAMSYDNIFAGFRQYAIHVSYHEKQVKRGVNVEGFASCFNAQIMRLGNYEFCSMLPENEKVFGCIGSFFDVSFKNKFVECAPPKVEQIIILCFNKCINEMNNYYCRFILLVPNWLDMPYIKMLDNEEFVKKYKIETTLFRKKTLIAEDFTTGENLDAIPEDFIEIYMESALPPI